MVQVGRCRVESLRRVIGYFATADEYGSLIGTTARVAASSQSCTSTLCRKSHALMMHQRSMTDFCEVRL